MVACEQLQPEDAQAARRFTRRHREFRLQLTTGPALRLHGRGLDEITRAYPWDSLDAAEYPRALVQRARLAWTESAFQEYATAVAMGQLVQSLGQAGAPIDLLGIASRIPAEEIVHVELCARVATQLGGLERIYYDPAELTIELDPSLSPLERASELIVRCCCVGEAFSLPLLAGALQRTRHPLIHAVLKRIAADEAIHGRLGWMYLGWIASELDVIERDRLGRAASESLLGYERLYERLRSQSVIDLEDAGVSREQVDELGWIDSARYRELAFESIAGAVREPLATFGIHVPLGW